MPSGGFKSKGTLGEKRIPLTVDPDEWLLSTFRAFKDHLSRNFDRDLYEIVGSFAEADDLARDVPLRKSLIHFEIDDIDNMRLGFGDGVVKIIEDVPDQSLTEEEAQWHEINFDMGIWASDDTGGVTARLEVYQRLCNLLDGPSAEERIHTETDGIEIRSFSGGRFDLEKVQDVRLFRVVDMELVVRVAGRKTSVPIPYIDSLQVEGKLDIDGVILTG